MKKLVIGLLVSLASCAHAASNGMGVVRVPLAETSWQKAVYGSNVKKLRKLWAKKQTVPTNQELLLWANWADDSTFNTLLDLASTSKPPVHTLLFQERISELEQDSEGNSQWSTALYGYARKGLLSRCQRMIELGADPYEPNVMKGGDQTNRDLNLFEALIISGQLPLVRTLEEAARQAGFLSAPEKVAVIPAALKAGKPLVALAGVLQQNIFQARQRLDECWPTLGNQTALMAITHGQMSDKKAATAAYLLIQLGANAKQKDAQTNLTPLDVVMSKRPKLVGIFENNGATPDTIEDEPEALKQFDVVLLEGASEVKRGRNHFRVRQRIPISQQQPKKAASEEPQKEEDIVFAALLRRFASASTDIKKK